MSTNSISSVIRINLAFWAVAILAPIVIRLIPTSSGSPAKFFEFGVPVFQMMLAVGTAHLIKTALAAKKDR